MSKGAPGRTRQTLPQSGATARPACGTAAPVGRCGRGYFMHLPAEALTQQARILAVADVFDALHAERPYREALPPEKVFAILEKDAPHALDGDYVQALKEAVG